MPILASVQLVAGVGWLEVGAARFDQCLVITVARNLAVRIGQGPGGASAGKQTRLTVRVQLQTRQAGNVCTVEYKACSSVLVITQHLAQA